jgi:hypothetical protein
MSKPKFPGWFKAWLDNDWKHMNWKVNAMIALMSVNVGFLIALFSLALTKMFGG